MNLKEWNSQAGAKLREGFRQVSATIPMRNALSVLEAEDPRGKIALPVGASGTDHAYAHGTIMGYKICMDLLRSLEEEPKADGQVESTFEEEKHASSSSPGD